MAFTTFTAESKSYMSYEKRGVFGKIRFWLYFPIASAKFHWYCWMDGRRTNTVRESR